MRHVSKKGLGVGQVFIFIVAALTFALITIFGYKAVTGFLERGEDVQFYQFKTDLEQSIGAISTEFGAVRIEEFHTPFRYSHICFVDMGKSYNADACNSGALDPLACNAWREGEINPEIEGYEQSGENVFLTPPAPAKIKVSRIAMDEGQGNFLCVNVVDGIFRLYLEGRGGYTLLREAPASS